MRSKCENFTIYSYRNTKPNQTQSPFCLQSASSAPQSGSSRAETLLTPTLQVSRPVLDPKSCRVTSANPSDPKDNTPQTFPSFSSENTNSTNANLEHTSVKFSRMLHSSLHGIKISQKNTLEKIFSPCGFQETLKIVRNSQLFYSNYRANIC